jgi:hypothetical protein
VIGGACAPEISLVRRSRLRMAASERFRLLYFLKLALPQGSVDLIETSESQGALVKGPRQCAASLK